MADPDKDEEDPEEMLPQEQEQGVTVVHEARTREAGSTHGSGGFGGGGMGGGGFDDGGGGGTVGVVVDGAGEVVGTATVNPDTGVAEASGGDVTVVEETSTPPDSSTSSAGGSAGTEGSDSEQGSEATPDSGHIPSTIISPTEFQFKNGPGNQQESRCVELRLAYLVAGRPVGNPVSVLVRIFAPRRTHKGTISNQQAGMYAAIAASEAAAVVIEGLELGLLDITSARLRFRTELNEQFRLQGNNFQAQQCFNS